jgi:hypothetical protein
MLEHMMSESESESEPMPEPASELEPMLAIASEPERAESMTPRAPKVEVMFSAGSYVFAWIRVDGREHALRPLAKLELSQGNHAIYVRRNKRRPWTRAGSLQIEGDGRYQVKFDRFGKLEIHHRAR